MKFLTSLTLSVLLLAGCAARAEEVATPPGMVSLEQFKEALPSETEQELDLEGFLALKKAGPVTVMDVRSPESFNRQHIKGSINAPLTDLTEKNLPTLAPDKTAAVVLVCDYSFMPTRMISMTMQAYPVLKTNGYQKIYRLNLWAPKSGGPMLTSEQIAQKLELETSAAPTP